MVQIDPGTGNEIRNVTLFLFNDAIMLAKRSKPKKAGMALLKHSKGAQQHPVLKFLMFYDFAKTNLVDLSGRGKRFISVALPIRW
jgi:hypothetical protein